MMLNAPDAPDVVLALPPAAYRDSPATTAKKTVKIVLFIYFLQKKYFQSINYDG
jgi:hypothetical protein